MRLSGKDAEIAIVKAELLTAQTEGPGTSVVQDLERENTELRPRLLPCKKSQYRIMMLQMIDSHSLFSPFLINLLLLSLSQLFPVSSLCRLSLCCWILTVLLMS